jgi:hypothetical protein
VYNNALRDLLAPSAGPISDLHAIKHDPDGGHTVVAGEECNVANERGTGRREGREQEKNKGREQRREHRTREEQGKGTEKGTQNKRRTREGREQGRTLGMARPGRQAHRGF